METTALKAVIFYESKLVRRSWLFYLFILGMLGYTIGVLIPWDIKRIIWSDIAFSSSIPLRGIYFLNLLQSLIVTFLVCDIRRKQNKAETREVFSSRPIGNGRFFFGKFFGVLIPFLVIDVIFMMACMVINIFVQNLPVNLWINLFYLLTHILPTLIFVTGLSLLVNRLVKYSFISWFILIGFLYFAYCYLVTPLHGMLDFRGSLLPDSFSTMVGFMHIEDYLLQRSASLLLGISFLYQVVVIERSLVPGENIELEIEYEGGIDEDIYQINIADEDYFAPVVYTSFHENYGKRSAFVSGEFTSLVPEVMWYPMAVPPMELQSSKEVNFTDYTLRVENPGEMTVLSQGESTREGNDVIFDNVQNLTGLSLCMGKYEKRAITVDSLTVELYTYPGNDFYMKISMNGKP